jgi:predicted DCC family thiol-disulfide oxidoreductase YuxK
MENFSGSLASSFAVAAYDERCMLCLSMEEILLSTAYRLTFSHIFLKSESKALQRLANDLNSPSPQNNNILFFQHLIFSAFENFLCRTQVIIRAVNFNGF